MVRQDSVNSVLDSFCLVAVVVVAAVAVVAVVAAGFQTPWLSSVAVARKVMREPFVFGAETRSVDPVVQSLRRRFLQGFLQW